MSTSRKQQQQLIFGGNSPTVLRLIKNQEAVEEEVDGLDERRDVKEGARKPSAYVEVFEAMARTVVGHEPELLSGQEIKALEMYSKLCYNTRYCLTRLVLRKPYQWHPISALEGYKREVGEDGLLSSIKDLCQPINSLLDEAVKEEPADPVKLEPMDTDIPIKREEGPQVIDLTQDSDDRDVKPDLPYSVTPFLEKHIFNHAGPSRLRPPRPHEEDPIRGVLEADMESMHLDTFCEDETTMSLHEILWRLNKDQLKELVKATRTKVESTAKKCDIIYALEDTAMKQTVLDFELAPSTKRKGKGKARDDGFRQTLLSFKKKSDAGKPPVTQEQRLREMAVERLGKCVRVNFDFHRLVRRLDIICYRQPEHPTSLMLPALLSVFKKRNFTMYKHSRCSDIWGSRQEFLEYEMALELEIHLEEIIDPPPDPYAKKAVRTPAPRKSEFVTPAPPAGPSCTTPLKTPGGIADDRVSEAPTTKTEDYHDHPEPLPAVEEEAQTPVEATKEQKITEHLNNWILSKWTTCVLMESKREVRTRPPGLERFDAGYVFTRMMYKATRVLGPAKKYDLELDIIEALLSQRNWHRGKRGSWYGRRAVVLGHLTRCAKDAREKDELRRRTLEGIKEALRDDDTHIVHRPSLFRRVEKLESALKVPKAERSTCEGDLRKPPTVVLEAERIPPLQLDTLGRPLERENTPEAPLLAYIPVTKVGKLPEEHKLAKRKTGKSRWKGRNNQIVDVETRALEFYEKKGYTGFHAETRILTTLFGLLFWDIIFADVPGAFDTPYQYAPLDIWSDSFYLARKALIDGRLDIIRKGGGRDILHEHDDLYRERQFICAGVAWDICKRDDLLNIVDCIGGESLAFICQLFCEDYKGRSSGAPDLFVWNIKERDCKFVEVKGPGDSPQENQKLWFDSLWRAGAAVEICKVVDVNTPPPKGQKRKAKTPGPAPAGNTVPPAVDEGYCDKEPDYDQLDIELEGAVDDPDHPLESPSKRKRRRIAHPEDDPPSVPRANKAEIILSPSKDRTV